MGNDKRVLEGNPKATINEDGRPEAMASSRGAREEDWMVMQLNGQKENSTLFGTDVHDAFVFGLVNK